MERYRGRISGPLLDRIDLHVEVPALAYEEIASAPLGEGTAPVECELRRRVLQRERFKGLRSTATRRWAPVRCASTAATTRDALAS